MKKIYIFQKEYAINNNTTDINNNFGIISMGHNDNKRNKKEKYLKKGIKPKSILYTKKGNTNKKLIIYIKKYISYYKLNFMEMLLEIFAIINFSLLTLSKTDEISSKILNFEVYSEITIKSNINGTQNILNSGYYRCPDEIYLNDKLIGEGVCSINLEDEEKTIKMRWIEHDITSCRDMFSDLKNIVEIDLSGFDTSNVIDMQSMFSGCTSLESINLSDINTSLVTNMQKMFYQCESLTSLNLSSFNNSIVLRTNSMFSWCTNLISLDLSSFNTSSVENMESMFSGCNSLESLDISSFNTSKTKSMSYMFNECERLMSLNLSHFETSLVTKMENIFSGCKSLKYLDISNFITSNVTNMKNMFLSCSNLITLDITGFDTSNVKDMFAMFSSCSSLKYLDLSSFNTSKITDMNYMFYGCSSLKSIDLSNFSTNSLTSMICIFTGCSSLISINFTNFSTNSVENMRNLFNGCSSLKSLDLSSFDTRNVYSMSSMFHGCKSLTYLNLSNFNTISLEDASYMFTDCKSLISLDLSNFETSKIIDFTSMFSGCNSLIKLNLTNIKTSNATSMQDMFSNCFSLESLDLSSFNTEKVTRMNKMFYNCSNLEFINFESIYETSSLIMTDILSETSDKLIMCINENNAKSIKELMSTKGCNNIDCSSNWKENQQKIKDENIICTANCINNTKYIFEYGNKCYDECPFGTIIINNNICILKEIENGTNEEYETGINTIEQTGLNKINETYFPKSDIYQKDESINLKTSINTNNYFSQSDLKIEEEEESVIIHEEKASSDISKYFEEEINENDKNTENICNAKEFFLKGCRKNIKTLEDKKEFKWDIINEIMNGEMDDILSVVVKEKKNIIIEENNDIYQMSTLSNQLDMNYNLSLVNLSECENILRKHYNIVENQEIIIFKIEHYIIGYNIPIIEYVLFNEDGKIKLELDVCNDTSVIYKIPVSINEDELFKYNPKSDYYNDKCYPYSSNNKTDIILYDRRNEYNDNNMSLCERNCTYKSYNSTTKKVDCECKLKFKIPFFEEIYIDQYKLLDKFINIKSATNILIMKCYKVLFSKNGIIYNIGSYILLSFIFISIIQTILFYFKEYNILSNRIKRIVQINFKHYKTSIPINYNINKIKKSNNRNEKDKNKKNTKLKKLITSLYAPPKKMLKKTKGKNIFQIKNISFNSNIYHSSKNNIKITKKRIEKKKISFLTEHRKNKNKNKKKNMKNYKDINDYEINAFSYNEALTYDKRTYCGYYFSLIRTKHLIIFTFFTKSDYNSRIIKINLFLFSFSLYYTVNTLFFNDSTMHQIFEDQGDFNFIYQIPQLIYSTIISSIIKKILTNLSLTESNIVNIKNKNNYTIAANEMKNLLKCLIIKFILFFIINFSFLFLFWYYISCFCAVYKKTQIYLIEDTFISFGISLLYPFILNLLPGMFRIPALKSANQNRKCLYKVSQLIQLI